MLIRLRSYGDSAQVGIVLRRLLVEEEERFGRYAERLDIADHHIALAGSRITDQKQRVEILKEKGLDTAEAERLLRNMLGLRDLLVAARKAWAESTNYIAR